jgi:hypothetical protein
MALDAQGPFNYNTIADQQTVSPAQAYTGGIGAGQAAVTGQIAVQGQAQGLLMQQQMQKDAAAVGANPTPQALAGLATKYPQLADKFKNVSEMMTTQQRDAAIQSAVPVYAAVQSGNYETAAKLMDNNAAAATNAGDTAKAAQYTMYANMIRQHPDQAKTLLAFPLIGAMGADKFAETFKTVNDVNATNAKLPAEVAKANADAATAGAQAAVAPQAAGLGVQKTAAEIADITAKQKQAADQLKSDTQVKMLELNQKYGAPEGANLELVNASVKASVQANADANRFQNFATEYANTVQGGGKSWAAKGFNALPANWQEGLKWATGNADSLTDIRNQYDIMRTKGLVANLPPQVTRLTDSDLKVFNAGIPSANASPVRAAAFLQSMALVKHVESATEDAKAQWAAANRSLANARSDITVNGVTAAAGTSFKKFLDDYLASDVKEYKQSINTASVNNAPYASFLNPTGAQR